MATTRRPGTAVPDAVHDALDVRGWSVRAASSRGVAAVDAGDPAGGDAPRQDAYAVRHGNGRIAVVVCDGVGGRPYSQVAASAASAALAEHLLTAELEVSGSWTEHLRVASLAVTRAAGRLLGDRAPRFGAVSELMATTLTALVLEDVTAPSRWLAHTVTVGDSSAWWRRTRGGSYRFQPWLLMSGGSAEGHPGGGQSLPLPDDAVVEGESYEIGPEELLLVCSDGIADAFEDGASRVAAAFASGWTNPPRLGDLAERIAYVPVGGGDRTAVAVWTPR